MGQGGDHPALFDGYTKGRGIIITRERFLLWLETTEREKDKEKVESDEKVVAASEKKFGKTIIMPIAVASLGATYRIPRMLMAMLNFVSRKSNHCFALAELFRLGHTPSDDVQVQRSAPAFIQNIKKLLQSHDVVVAYKLSE